MRRDRASALLTARIHRSELLDQAQHAIWHPG
jgi:hypothetical protein